MRVRLWGEISLREHGPTSPGVIDTLEETVTADTNASGSHAKSPSGSQSDSSRTSATDAWTINSTQSCQCKFIYLFFFFYLHSEFNLWHFLKNNLIKLLKPINLINWLSITFTQKFTTFYFFIFFSKLIFKKISKFWLFFEILT